MFFYGSPCTCGRWSEMKQAQVTKMTGTMAQLERDVQPGRWEDGVADEEVSQRWGSSRRSFRVCAWRGQQSRWLHFVFLADIVFVFFVCVCVCFSFCVSVGSSEVWTRVCLCEKGERRCVVSGVSPLEQRRRATTVGPVGGWKAFKCYST